MFCSKCGSNLSDDAVFCGRCGSPVTAKQSQPKHAAQPSQITSGQPLQALSSAPAPARAPGGAAAAHKPISKTAVVAGLVIILAMAAVVVAGTLTNCFGLGAKPVYVPTKITNYIGGKKSMVSTIEYDENGAVKERTNKNYSDGQVSLANELSYKNDDNGYTEEYKFVSRQQGDKSSADDTKVTYECDNGFEGKSLVKRTITNSYSDFEVKYQFEYHDNGQVKRMRMESDTGASSVYDYDERGYILHEEVKYTKDQAERFGREGRSSDCEWEFDASGKPTGYTQTSDDSDEERKYTVETDDAGNITAIFDEDGKKVQEMEWQRIDKPCPHAQVMQLRVP